MTPCTDSWHIAPTTQEGTSKKYKEGSGPLQKVATKARLSISMPHFSRRSHPAISPAVLGNMQNTRAPHRACIAAQASWVVQSPHDSHSRPAQSNSRRREPRTDSARRTPRRQPPVAATRRLGDSSSGQRRHSRPLPTSPPDRSGGQPDAHDGDLVRSCSAAPEAADP